MSTPVSYSAPQNSSNAIAALIMAVLGWVVVPVALPIVALVLAQRAEQEIRAAQGWLTGFSLVSAARWVAWVNIALYGFLVVVVVVSVVIFALVVALSVAFGTTSPN